MTKREREIIQRCVNKLNNGWKVETVEERVDYIQKMLEELLENAE